MKIAIFDSGVDTPEEIIMAAGFVPFRLFGDPSIEPDKANEHIPPTHCVWTRNLLELAINKLDEDVIGLVTTHGCDRTNREFDIWRECVNLDFMYFLNSPRKRDKTALKFLINDIKEFITQLEGHFKIKINEDDLKLAIKKMNEIRKLLREISDYRNNMIIAGSEFHGIVKSVQRLPKDEALVLLKSKLENLKTRQPFSKKDFKRILLTGSDLDDTEFIRYIESLGFQIVIDDLGVGTKYFANDIEENGNPIESIAKYHLDKPIHATKFPSYQRFEVLKKLATEYKVDGVMNIAQKFCEPVLYDHPFLKKKFKELAIPYLFAEVTYSREAYKQLSTRFSAFAEII
ncbi:MAG: 2-hydroxyacyl-CoA dehydratase family protein [Promethearchaeota archaeon]